MTETSAFRRLAATLTIGSFSIAALMGIVALLAGGSFGPGEGRVLLTTLIVGCASVCVLCYLATADTRWAPIGFLGIVVAMLPTAVGLILIWSDLGDGSGGFANLLKLFGIGVVAAATLAQICLLLALAGSRDELALPLWATVCLAVGVAILISAMILGDGAVPDLWRLIGILAILDVLGTLVTIALAKFSGSDRDGGRGSRPMPSGVGLTVRVCDDQALELDILARRSGRSAEHLVAEAVDRFLHA